MSGAPAVEIRGVGKRFGGAVALDDVTFDVTPGELHAVCGENGAGKSTLMKILSGVITDYAGEVRLFGRPVRFTSARDADAAGVAIIHQELNLVEELSVAANIFLGREKYGRLGLLDERAMQAEAAKLLAQLECDADPRRPVGRLRVGDQQLVEIAKALSLSADVLIMDEPTSALTESEVERLYRVIANLKERGVTILYISHKMAEVFALADRVTVFRDGRFVATKQISETNPAEVTQLMVGREIGPTKRNARTPGEVVLKVADLSLTQRKTARPRLGRRIV